MRLSPKIKSFLSEGPKQPGSLFHASKTAATAILILSSGVTQPTKESKVPITPHVVSKTFSGLDKKEIEILKRLHDIYGIDLVYNETSDTGKVHHSKAKITSFILEAFEKAFQCYPAEFIRAHGPKKIILADKLYWHENDDCPNGAQCHDPKCPHLSPNLLGYENWDEGRTIYVKLRHNSDGSFRTYDTILTLHHEMTHCFGEGDSGITAKEDLIWVEQNTHGFKSYRSTQWDHAEHKTQFNWVLGFESEYGTKNSEEDRATISAGLHVPKRAHELLVQTKYDLVLRHKIEMLTGCEIDIRHNCFSKTYSKREYDSKFGFSSWAFFKKWSASLGIETFDCTYWNGILEKYEGNHLKNQKS